MVAAAEASFQAGAFDAVQRLLATAESHGLDGLLQRPEPCSFAATWRRCSATATTPRHCSSRRRTKLEPFDLELARVAYADRLGSAFVAGHLGRRASSSRSAEPSQALLRPGRSPGRHDLLLDGLALLTTDGRAAATPILQRAAKRPRTDARGGRPPMGVGRADGQQCDVGLRTARRDLRAPSQHRPRCRSARGTAAVSLRLGAGKAWNGDLAGADSTSPRADTVAAATGASSLHSRRSGSSRWKARKPTPPR